MTRKKQPSVLKRYMLSYIFVFSIPLILLVFLINTIYIQNIREDITQLNETYLTQLDAELDRTFDDLHSMRDFINHENSFPAGAVYMNNQYNEYNNLVRVYRQAVDSVQSMFIIYPNQSFIFSPHGTNSIEALLEYGPEFKSADNPERLREMMMAADEQLYAERNKIYYTIPIGASNYAQIMYVVNASHVRDLLGTLGSREVGMTLLLNENNDIVLNSDYYQTLDAEMIEDIDFSFEDEMTARLDGINYHITQRTNERTGWKFVALTDINKHYRSFYQALGGVGMGLFVLLLVGLAISYYLARRHYQPIEKLTDLLSQDSDDQERTGDEWQYLQKQVTSTFSNVESLSSKMNEQALFIRNSILLDLIEGKYTSDDQFRQHAASYEIELPFRYKGVIIVEFGDNPVREASETVEHIASAIRDRLNRIYYSLEPVIPLFKNNELYIIANFDVNNDDSMIQIMYYIRKICRQFNWVDKDRLKFAIGLASDEYTYLNNSYIQASAALERLNTEQNDDKTVYFFKELETQPTQETIHYPEKDVLLLIQSLKQANLQTAQEVVEQLFADLQTLPPTNDFLLQANVAYVWNELIQFAESFALTEEGQLLTELSQFTDLTEARQLLDQFIVKICREMAALKKAESSEIEKNVVQAIYDNYTSADLSLENIASENNISVSYASKLVKEETGESFSNIVQNLRMDRFKELLVSTNRPIKELVAEVGYFDVSNFTRKFRIEHDMTPGQYRKKHQIK
ncbi:helix-turn-helix domain-containing protein [Dolosigranulum pigrum]|uniref:helix-turn-helix domain-containing protein n=1 Tax=Dolosigranulum pigrum TaxID=29394 RepID=UPI001AD87CDF|nr:helix-turn-helix domain-containing protein [Dolosigranulum pigrum]QTJ52117.1 helix-turn-helix domain-containing protein [Dolosigranulum pigrum]